MLVYDYYSFYSLVLMSELVLYIVQAEAAAAAAEEVGGCEGN